MLWTNDPIADFERWDAEQQKALEKRPMCADCENHIQDDFCYEFNGEYICERCLEDLHRKWVEFC